MNLQAGLQSSHMIAEITVIEDIQVLLLNVPIKTSLVSNCVVTTLILASVNSG